jgi:hypothetical protein
MTVGALRHMGENRQFWSAHAGALAFRAAKAISSERVPRPDFTVRSGAVVPHRRSSFYDVTDHVEPSARRDEIQAVARFSAAKACTRNRAHDPSIASTVAS